MNKRQALYVAKKIANMSMKEVVEASRRISINVESQKARAFLYEVIDARIEELCNKTECARVETSSINDIT